MQRKAPASPRDRASLCKAAEVGSATQEQNARPQADHNRPCGCIQKTLYRLTPRLRKTAIGRNEPLKHRRYQPFDRQWLGQTIFLRVRRGIVGQIARELAREFDSGLDRLLLDDWPEA